MEISASMVKELREMTGCGMLDCKKALAETNGDMEAAVDYLRKKGLAGAQKKAGRITAEGVSLTKISDDKKTGVLVEVNSETDFVAKNEKFNTYVMQVANQALKSSDVSIDKFMEEKWELDTSKTVKEELSTQISIIGENLTLRRIGKLSNANGFIGSYIHAAGKIGVLISLDCDKVNDKIEEAAKHLCMQIASMRAKYVSMDEINDTFKENEKKILLEKYKNDPKNAGKPDDIIAKMVEGGLTKELKEVCLLDQAFIMAADGKQTCKQYLDQVAKDNGASVKVKEFIRFETGEGIEKKEEDFAAEVAKQIGK